jgi:chemotaxis family two-component system response regulator Rcp1
MLPTEILFVENNPGDVRLAKEAFKECKFNGHIQIATDGVEALEFMYKKGRFANAATPDLIILDLNLPKKSGVEILIKLKEDEELRIIPIIILTTSQSEQDVLVCYKLHANCFVSKPFEYKAFVKLVEGIGTFWLNIVKLPKINYSHAM